MTEEQDILQHFLANITCICFWSKRSACSATAGLPVSTLLVKFN